MAKLTVPQKLEIARTLGVDASSTKDLLAAARRLGERHHEREYEELDPTGILKIDAKTATVTAERKMTATTAADSAIDAAVGRGAIGSDEREEWRRRFQCCHRRSTLRRGSDEIARRPESVQDSGTRNGRCRSGSGIEPRLARWS